MGISPKSSFYSVSKTVSDVATPITEYSLPFYTANIHNYTNDIYYGDGVIQAAKIVADGVADFRNGDLGDIFVKNVTGGSNGALVAVITVPTSYIKKMLGVTGLI